MAEFTSVFVYVSLDCYCGEKYKKQLTPKSTMYSTGEYAALECILPCNNCFRDIEIITFVYELRKVGAYGHYLVTERTDITKRVERFEVAFLSDELDEESLPICP